MGFLSEFLMKNGKNLFFLLWLHMGMNLFVWRIEHGKFEKRIFEKAVNSFFFLFFINVLLFLFPYLPYIYGSILAVICFVEILFYLEDQSLFTSNKFLVLQETNVEERDRKSTRLNSSHANISYAVFCLKKKKKHSSNLI